MHLLGTRRITETPVNPVAPAASLVPYPVNSLQRQMSQTGLTAFRNRAKGSSFIQSTSKLSAKEIQKMASAEAQQSMKIGGTVKTSPAATGLFPLILMAGIFVLILLKK